MNTITHLASLINTTLIKTGKTPEKHSKNYEKFLISVIPMLKSYYEENYEEGTMYEYKNTNAMPKTLFRKALVLIMHRILAVVMLF